MHFIKGSKSHLIFIPFYILVFSLQVRFLSRALGGEQTMSSPRSLVPPRLHSNYFLLIFTNLLYLHGLCLVHCFDCCLCHGSCCKSHKCTTWGKNAEGNKSLTLSAITGMNKAMNIPLKKKKKSLK